MEQNLAKSARLIQKVLDTCAPGCTVKELPSSARTAKCAASILGCSVAQIVKSLIFQTSDTQSPVLALVSGANQVDVTRLEKAVGEKIVKADPHFVKKVTGFAIGGVPPLGHKEHIAHIYIDQDLLAHDFVWAAAGTPESVFCIKTQALISLTQGCICDLASKNYS